MKGKNLYTVEDQIYDITTYGNDYIIFASMTFDFWSKGADWTFVWEISVYKITQFYNHPSVYAHQKPLLRYSQHKYSNLSIAKHDMYNQIAEIESMYESGELAKRDGMYVNIHNESLTDLKNAAMLAETELDMIQTFGLSDDRLEHRLSALNKLSRILKQLRGEICD